MPACPDDAAELRMSRAPHLAHDLSGGSGTPDWPVLRADEVRHVLDCHAAAGRFEAILWHSPRPFSAAALIQTTHARCFIKRHYHSVRSVADLTQEHAFITHLRGAGLPVPRVLTARSGASAIASGEWVYELHEPLAGDDLHRDTVSWIPVPRIDHARSAGALLARLHLAAHGHVAVQRRSHLLVARSDLIRAPDPIAALQTQLPLRPGLADYLGTRDWHGDIRRSLLPWHARAVERLRRQPPLWSHGDWHVSNLAWHGNEACGAFDFGLAAENFALFDLATAIERNAIAWLDADAVTPHPDLALALLDGYHGVRPLTAMDIHLLADLLPLVHFDFALSEVEYFHAVTHSKVNADLAFDTFLIGHADWFQSPPGQSLLHAIHAHAEAISAPP